MNHTIEQAVGLTAKIQKAQIFIYDRIIKLWGVNGTDFPIEGYGLVFINEEIDKMIPEAFVKNRDYSGNLLTSDKSKFFFISQGKEKAVGNLWRVNVDICFIVDLKKCYPSVTHRATSETHRDVDKILKDMSFMQIAPIDFTERIANVFKGLNFKYTDDLQPAHVFKFTIEILYGMNDKC